MKKFKLAILWLLAFSFPLFANVSYKSALVAESPYQWTGIAISKNNRVFVNFPTWDQPSPYKVAEIVQGVVTPFPSQNINDELFIAVQSVVIDEADKLWILDTGNPKFQGVISNKAKLFLVSLQSNQIEKEYIFPADVALEKSYLNDLRVDTKRNFAYLTDSTLGGIIVLNLENGQSWRALDSTVKAVQANFDRLTFPSTGVWENTVASDGIELSEDGELLYFTALSGDILYQVPTAILRESSKLVAERAKAIVTLNQKNVPTDGMLLQKNKLYMADLPKERLWVFDLGTKKGRNIDLGFPVRWADSFAADKSGAIHFTTSQINYPAKQRETYKIYKIEKEYAKGALYRPVVELDIDKNLTPLHQAVIDGNIEQAKTLIEKGADVNGLDKLMGIAPLHIAVQGRNLAMVKLLVENGAFVNLQSVRLGGTPLLLAVWHRNVDAVEYLLSLSDIDTSVLSASGMSALQFNRGGKYPEDQMLNEDVEKINKLFAKHQEKNLSLSQDAAAIEAVVSSKMLTSSQKVLLIKKLIELGHDVNALAPVQKKGTDFHSALLVAALTNQLEVAKLLLDSGADQTLPGAYMAAIALHKAAYNGHAKMLTLLSQYPGFKEVLNARGPNNGYTPLHDAVWHGHKEAAKVLVANGARLDLKGFDGNTPEQLARQSGYDAIAKFLQEAAAPAPAPPAIVAPAKAKDPQ